MVAYFFGRKAFHEKARRSTNRMPRLALRPSEHDAFNVLVLVVSTRAPFGSGITYILSSAHIKSETRNAQ